MPAEELTLYCLHALAAAGSMREPAAVKRLIQATLTGLEAHAATSRGGNT